MAQASSRCWRLPSTVKDAACSGPACSGPACSLALGVLLVAPATFKAVVLEYVSLQNTPSGQDRHTSMLATYAPSWVWTVFAAK